MRDFLKLLLALLAAKFKSRSRIEAEILVLRQQLNVLQRTAPKRPKLTNFDRLLFVWLYRRVPELLRAVTVVRPETVVRWHRGGFRLYWRWKSRSVGGRPRISADLRRLIREMGIANPEVGPYSETVWRPG
jgi:hypothetical protein